MTPLVVALAWSSTACSQAQEPSRVDEANKPEVVKTIEQQGLEVLGEFEAPGGLRGFAGVAGQRPVGVYVTPDGKHAVVGVLVNAQGEDVGAAALQRIVAEPMATKTWAQLEDSNWVRDGQADAPRVVYTFSDANCPYCHRFWEAARPWVESGKVQLRHVLVGVIRDDSANKAAAILESDSPAEALTYNERNFDNGGIDPMATVPQHVRSKLRENEMLMVELGFQGTPGILFRDDAGLVQRRSGMPRPADLPVVLGRP
ncbi:MAG: thiol:disulfide interchange protein DsbG [Lysobacter sp.]